MEPTITLPAVSTIVRWLFPAKRKAIRARLATEIFDFYHWLGEAVSPTSDRDVASKLGSALPKWLAGGLIAPVDADHLRARLRLLGEPGVTAVDQQNRDECRRELADELWRLYEVLTSTDPITREWRSVRHNFSTRAENRALKGRTRGVS